MLADFGPTHPIRICRKINSIKGHANAFNQLVDWQWNNMEKFLKRRRYVAPHTNFRCQKQRTTNIEKWKGFLFFWFEGHRQIQRVSTTFSFQCQRRDVKYFCIEWVEDMVTICRVSGHIMCFSHETLKLGSPLIKFMFLYVWRITSHSVVKICVCPEKDIKIVLVSRVTLCDTMTHPRTRNTRDTLLGDIGISTSDP